MAQRLVFFPTSNEDSLFYKEELTSFTFYSGFSVSQKQKSIDSLHKSIIAMHHEAKPLEVSSKSEVALGVRLSAFNLSFRDEETNAIYKLENVFQSSKVYEFGGPYLDLLNVSPAEAKKDTRHHTSGALKCFRLRDWECQLEPKTMFYDWIYCKSLSQNLDLAEALVAGGYDAFTDIEFNHNKSLNCQARSVAIFVSLKKRGLLSEFLDDKAKWETIYKSRVQEPKPEQIKFSFD